MSYQVLARKWRPRDFEALVGQEHVVRALRNSLEQGRLHHAYLFTGTRGVGKTTLARILAKCLNCQSGITPAPCGRCTPCLEIDAGRFVDYVEMDAASNRGVDEMTQLLERAVYAPATGRFKVYVIDEVHQLSGHAFNAMLKTLEEPPQHLKFILATTDPQKVPVTVLSRCLQFNLKQMPQDRISGHLERILRAEAVPFEADALPLIARAAAGSMRDALSLLDQAIAHGAGRIKGENVRAMLGTIDATIPFRVLEAVVRDDARAVLAVADELQSRALSFETALQDLAALLLRISIAHCAPEALESDLPDRDRIVTLAERIDPESAQLFYQIALQGREDLALAPDGLGGFTMTLLRMLAFRPEDSVSASARDPEPRAQAPLSAPARDGAGFDGDWPKLARQLAVTGATRELARNSELARYAEGSFDLVVPQPMAHLADRGYQDKLRAALEQHFGRPVRLQVTPGDVRGVSAAALEAGERHAKRAESARAIESDRFVSDLVTLLDGRVLDSRGQAGSKE